MNRYNIMIGFLSIFALVVLGFAACSGESPSTAERTKSAEERIKGYPPYSEIFDFTLSDGTRCIYITGTRKSGLSCDFKDDINE